MTAAAISERTNELLLRFNLTTAAAEKTACFDPRSQGGFWTEGKIPSRRALCPRFDA